MNKQKWILAILCGMLLLAILPQAFTYANTEKEEVVEEEKKEKEEKEEKEISDADVEAEAQEDEVQETDENDLFVEEKQVDEEESEKSTDTLQDEAATEITDENRVATYEELKEVLESLETSEEPSITITITDTILVKDTINVTLNQGIEEVTLIAENQGEISPDTSSISEHNRLLEIESLGNTRLNLQNITFNGSGYATGIRLKGDWTISSEHVLFEDFSGSLEGTNEENSGAALEINGQVALVSTEDLVFNRNTSRYGGAIFLNGGGLEVGEDSTIEFTDNTAKGKRNFDDDVAGGAIYVKDGSFRINGQHTKVDFVGNIVDESVGTGGAIAILNSDFIIGETGSPVVNFLNNKIVEDDSYKKQNSTKGGGALSSARTVDISNAASRVQFLNGDITFDGNEAFHGGAIFLDEGTTTIDGGVNVDIKNNKAKRGGGIYTKAGALNFTSGHVVIENNEAIDDGTFAGQDGMDGAGGGIFFYTGNGSINTLGADLVLEIVNNKAKFGGGISGPGGKVNIQNGTIDISRNTAIYGGGISTGTAAKLIISDGIVTINDNEASEYGGAISSKEEVTISGGDVTFARNKTKHYGGAIYEMGSKAAIQIGGANLDILFDNNTALNGGGGAIASGWRSKIELLDGTIVFKNNIAHSGGAILSESTKSNSGWTDAYLDFNGDDITFDNNIAYDFGGAVAPLRKRSDTTIPALKELDHTYGNVTVYNSPTYKNNKAGEYTSSVDTDGYTRADMKNYKYDEVSNRDKEYYHRSFKVGIGDRFSDILVKEESGVSNKGASKSPFNNFDVAYEPVYSVTYDGNGHTGGYVPMDYNDYKKNERVFVEYGGTLENGDKEFIEWNTKADGKGDGYQYNDEFILKGDTTLFAIWKDELRPEKPEVWPGVEAKLKVIYHTNYKESEIIEIDDNNGAYYKVGSQATISQNTPVRRNYTFLGWTTDKEGKTSIYKGKDSIELNQSVNLYAQWEEVKTQADGGLVVHIKLLDSKGELEEPSKMAESLKEMEINISNYSDNLLVGYKDLDVEHSLDIGLYDIELYNEPKGYKLLTDTVKDIQINENETAVLELEYQKTQGKYVIQYGYKDSAGKFVEFTDLENSIKVEGYKDVGEKVSLEEKDMPSFTGYFFTEITPSTMVIDKNPDNNIIQVVYEKGVAYTIQYGYLNNDIFIPFTDLDASIPLKGFGKLHSIVLESDVTIPTIKGYVYEKSIPNQIELQKDEKENVIKLVYTSEKEEELITPPITPPTRPEEPENKPDTEELPKIHIKPEDIPEGHKVVEDENGNLLILDENDVPYGVIDIEDREVPLGGIEIPEQSILTINPLFKLNPQTGRYEANHKNIAIGGLLLASFSIIIGYRRKQRKSM